jgi:protein-arginine kinase activator protein McsA
MVCFMSAKGAGGEVLWSVKRLCSECGQRPSTFRYKGRISKDRAHDLCQQCANSYLESNRQTQEVRREGVVKKGITGSFRH